LIETQEQISEHAIEKVEHAKYNVDEKAIEDNANEKTIEDNANEKAIEDKTIPIVATETIAPLVYNHDTTCPLEDTVCDIYEHLKYPHVEKTPQAHFGKPAMQHTNGMQLISRVSLHIPRTLPLTYMNVSIFLFPPFFG
jgi:hypothetical protein